MIFPGATKGRPLSNDMLKNLLKRAKLNSTLRGFRSSFRDCASGRANIPRSVAEVALAHAVRDQSEAAYAQLVLFERRRGLMDAWGAVPECRTGRVIDMDGARRETG